jgi:hypothetical protein
MMSYVVTGDKGPGCPRCGRPMQVREHDRIRARQSRAPYYYGRWFYCTHKNCRTKTVMFEKFKVFNSDVKRRLDAIRKQLQPPD